MPTTTSPVQHALAIRELLSRIFLHSTTASNAVNARVCKLWSNEALSVNWYNIEADALLNLLEAEEPLDLVSDMCVLGTGNLADPLQWPFRVSNWARFDEYAWRVRVLSFRPKDDFLCVVFNQALKMKFKRNGPLVPNLSALAIDFELDMVRHIIALFGHSSVRSLTLEPCIFDDFEEFSEQLEMALSIFKTALINMPSLRTFRVLEYDEVEESFIAVQAFASIIGGFHQLEEVQIPTFWLTDPVVDSLASLPCLRSLEIRLSDTPSLAQFSTIPAMINNYFPSLERLHIDTDDVNQAIKWLAHPRFPRTLTSLVIYLDQPNDNQTTDGCIHLLEVIGSQLRHLRTLHLEQPSCDVGTPYSFETVRPLLWLSDLRHISLMMVNDIIISQNELVGVFKALPFLESFYIPNSTPVDISCLAEIAPIARQLEVLVLNWCTPPHGATLPRVHLPFAQLKSISGDLRFDLPPIAVAEFFEDVLLPECNVPKTWGLVYDVRAAFARVREKERRKRAPALGWVYVGPVVMGHP
ncbi:hypothetical protein EYR38_004921 [Pleurotus pulmonarius]|nr:hypothetical protein EYR38_004921 [Pleurotus pulmonarius]